MNTTLTGRFEDIDQARMARDDLIWAGIPQEKIHVDEDQKQIKVTVPETQSPQILDVFKRRDITEAK